MTDDPPFLPGTEIFSEDAPNHGRDFLARNGGIAGGVGQTPQGAAAWAVSDDYTLSVHQAGEQNRPGVNLGNG